MSIRDAPEPGQALPQTLSSVRKLGITCFRADAAWKDFPGRCKILQLAHDGLVSRLERYGHRLDQDTLESLRNSTEEADMQLTEDSADFEIDCANSENASTSAATFVKAAESAHKRIKDELENCLQDDSVWREEEPSGEPSRLAVGNDPQRYVPRELLEREISLAVEEAEAGPAIVLVYGGPGKGKSTLAKQVASKYTDGRNSTFQKVVLLECGPGMDVPSKKRELLQMLWSEDEPPCIGVQYALQECLSVPNVLIVLDDLWKSKWIVDLVNFSDSDPGAKFLVTSQRGSICNQLECEEMTFIPIDCLTHMEARKILACHVGFEDQTIPGHLQRIADKFIFISEGNPLVLATLGAHISGAAGEIKDNLDVWNDVLDLFFKLVGEQESAHEQECPKAFLATMKIVFHALSKIQQHIIVLMGLCRNPSLFKYAVEFLYNAAFPEEKCSRLKFSCLSNDLKSRNVLFENEVGNYSIHPLTRKFVLQELKQELGCVETSLRDTLVHESNRNSPVPKCGVPGKGLKSTFITILAYKYTNISVGLFISCDVKRKLEVIENTTQLVLTSPQSEDCRKVVDLLGMVLLRYVRADQLDQTSIADLLSSPIWLHPTLTFLEDISRHKNSSFWQKNANRWSGVAQFLINILHDDSCASLHVQASAILSGLCSVTKDSSSFEMIFRLAPMVGEVHIAAVQRNLANALQHSLIVRHTVGVDDVFIEKTKGLFSMFGDALAKGLDSDVQTAVVSTLSRLTEFIKHQVASQPELHFSFSRKPSEAATGNEIVADPTRVQHGDWSGLFESLATLLVHNEGYLHAALQDACSFVGNLLAASHDTGVEEVLDHSRLVNALVDVFLESLQGDEFIRHFVTYGAADALLQLSKYRAGTSVRMNLADYPRVLGGVAESLRNARDLDPSCRHSDDGVAGVATSILANLTFETNKEIAEKVIDHPGLLEDLVERAYRTLVGGCTDAAARAIVNLTHFGEERVRAKLPKFPSLLGRLIVSSWFPDPKDFVIVFLQENLSLHASESTSQIAALVDLCSRMVRRYDWSGTVDETSSEELLDPSVVYPDEATLGELLDESGLAGGVVKVLYDHPRDRS